MKAIFALAAVAAVLLLGNANAADRSRQQMVADAKVDRTHAEVIARGRVRNGKVQSSKITREKERLLWIVEIEMPGTTQLNEVRVDAKTGKVISVRKPAKRTKS